MHKNLIITRIYVYNVSKQNPFPKKYDEKGNSSLMDRASHESCARFDGSKAGRGWRAVFPERLYPARVVVADHERGEERSSDRESWRITARNRRSVPFLFFFLLLLSIERVFVPPFLSSPRTIRRNRPPSKRNKLNLAGFQRSWRNSSNRPTIFIARPNLLAPTWIARIFFFWGKKKSPRILLEAEWNLRKRLLVRRRDLSLLFSEREKKNNDYKRSLLGLTDW